MDDISKFSIIKVDVKGFSCLYQNITWWGVLNATFNNISAISWGQFY